MTTQYECGSKTAPERRDPHSRAALRSLEGALREGAGTTEGCEPGAPLTSEAPLRDRGHGHWGPRQAGAAGQGRGRSGVFVPPRVPV